MTSKEHTFWCLSNKAGTETDKGTDKRWAMEAAIDVSTDSLISRHNGPIDIPLITAEADRPNGIEDMPLVYPTLIVVSDRARDIFVEAGRNDCQFLPIDIKYQGGSLGLSYWVMHVLRTIDCIDPTASSRASDIRGEPYYYRVRIIPEKVPDDVSTFRAQYGNSTPIVRDSLRRKLKRAKITGCDFYAP